MIEPVIATALILSILALIAYYLQPQQPHHQRHYYHQVRRSRVMTDPQRRGRGGGVERGAERRGGGGEVEVYEQENEEGEGGDDGRGEVAIGVRESGLIGRGVVGSNLGLKGGGDDGDKERLGAKGTGECHGRDADGVDVSTRDSDVYTEAGLQRGSPPIIRITAPDDNIASTILPIYDAEHGIAPESCYYNTLDQQRRQRVRFDEALRMHSYGGSQYVGRVVDRDV